MGETRFRMSLAQARILRWFVAALALISAQCIAGPAEAYPWMIRHGVAQCGSCHTDPMGGETLTGFGRAIGDSKLATQWDGDDTPTSAAQLLYALEEPRWARVGGSIRAMSLYRAPRDGGESSFRTFPMQSDVYGQLRFGDLRVAGSLGVARVPEGSPHARAAQVTTAQGESMNLLSRNHWVGYDVADGWLVRAGRMNLPFGMRTVEHVMWAREATRSDRESDQQHGLAVSYAKGRWRGEVMGIAGNFQINPDDYRERGYAMHGEYVLTPAVALGLSSLYTRASIDRLTGFDDYGRQAHGVTARVVPLADVAVLAEVDVLKNTGQGLGHVSMLQVDYELIGGLHLMGTFEALDTGSIEGLPDAPGSGEPRLGGWLTVNWFFVSHWDLRVDAVVRENEPFTLQSQAHFYF
jgi:hypothetical protein